MIKTGKQTFSSLTDNASNASIIVSYFGKSFSGRHILPVYLEVTS